MAKFTVAYTTTCVSYYEEEVEADSKEQAIQMVQDGAIELAMDEIDHDCGSPIVTGIIEEGEF